jgi:hypothetical protein
MCVKSTQLYIYMCVVRRHIPTAVRFCSYPAKHALVHMLYGLCRLIRMVIVYTAFFKKRHNEKTYGISLTTLAAIHRATTTNPFSG